MAKFDHETRDFFFATSSGYRGRRSMQSSSLDVGRYRFVRELGRGAMGAVSLVHDSIRGHDVACKRLASDHGSHGVHFKKEFRVLSRLLHPNLVRVHELGSDAQGLYFLMEVVDGVPLDAHCAAQGRYEALQHVLPQILDALAFIHAHGVVHRDLKPNNVLVNAEGVVKLLDFGVLGLAAQDRGGATVAGTPGYMAPEQIRGDPPVPASDLYALGCIVFEIIAGRAPFEGSRSQVLEAHRTLAAPPLRKVAPEVPPIYDRLLAELLDKEPARRPGAAELAERLARAFGAGSVLPRRPPRVLGELVGRASLISELVRLVRTERAPIVALVGPSGVGKTAVAERLARELERDDWFVLRSGARPSERVAYNALDGAVDEIASALARRQAADPEVQRAARVARKVFPVLAASGFPTSERTKELVRFRLFGRGAALSRPSVFGALHSLMRSAAGQKPRIAMAIDDFQWADDDSLAMLSHVDAARADAPTLIVSLRDDVGDTAAARWLETRRDVRRVRVPPLAEEALALIVARVARELGREPSGEELTSAVRAAEGRPFLAEVAGRALAVAQGLDLTTLARGRSELERTVLGLLVASDDWTPGPLLAELAGHPLGAVDDAIASLAHDGLVRRGGRAGLEGVVQLYHDGVRRAVGEALGDVKLAHQALADHWLSVAGAPPERRVRHLLGAERVTEAAEQARIAAHAAEEQRAFGLAADMYEVALRVPSRDDETLREARARALEKVGRHREAALLWSDLARGGGAERRLDRALNEASAWIASNEVSRGLDRLDTALVDAGDAPIQSRTLGSLVAGASFVLGPRGRHVRSLLGLNGRQAASVIDAQRDVRIGILLSFLDPVSGIRYLLRARDRYAAAGARAQEASCNLIFAALALIGNNAQRVPLADRYEREAERAISASERPREVGAMAAYVEGLRALRRGRWHGARASIGRAAREFEAVDAPTEYLMSMSWSMMADVYRQDVPAVRSNLAWFRRNLRELDGALVIAHVELYQALVTWFDGRFDEAFAATQQIVEMYSGRRPNVQRGGALLYRHMSDLYRDRDDRGRREFLAAKREVREFRFFDTMFAGGYALIGALLEAQGLQRREPDASEARLEWFARRVDESPPFAAGASWRARAYAAEARGDAATGLAHLERAERVASGYGRALDAAIARYQRGLRLGGDEGRRFQSEARAAVQALGASELLLAEDPTRR
jgi:hypothetical protein